MIIKLGYACITKTLEGVTTSSTCTYTDFSKTNNYEKIDKTIKSNLLNLIKILTYNNKNNIHFYRLSSNIIPLATHNKVVFDYLDKYKIYYKKISSIIEESNQRVDMHPSTYCILNSTRKEVVENSIEILKYHYNILSYMNVKDILIIIHIGSNTFGKKNSITRFINNYEKLPEYLKKCIAIENDDKTFTIEDCLYINEKTKIPVVLDYHHFICNNNKENIVEVIEKVINTWETKTPKMHFSSPKNKKEYRAHNDYIDASKFIDFLILLSKYNKNVDIMIEAKAKDEALFRLIRELKYKTNYKFLDDTTIKIKE